MLVLLVIGGYRVALVVARGAAFVPSHASRIRIPQVVWVLFATFKPAVAGAFILVIDLDARYDVLIRS